LVSISISAVTNCQIGNIKSESLDKDIFVWLAVLPATKYTWMPLNSVLIPTHDINMERAKNTITHVNLVELTLTYVNVRFLKDYVVFLTPRSNLSL
jgi:hypothetical protein